MNPVETAIHGSPSPSFVVPYVPIAKHQTIGDRRTAALVGNLGLLAEDVDAHSGAFLGNTPLLPRRVCPRHSGVGSSATI